MRSFCRFCRKKSLSLLFCANKTKIIEDPGIFVCTNCGFGHHGTIVKCNYCGLIYVQEKISQNQISTYYEIAQDPLYLAEQNARKKTFFAYLKKLEKHFLKKGKLLDIGTNTGLFVRVARDCGWEASGLEPSHWAVTYAKKNYHLDLINKSFEKNTFPAESFEVVTLWDVVEHFTNPVAELKKVYHQLKPGGMLAFSTTDPQSLLAKLMGTRWSWYMDMHRVFFSRKAAAFYLKKVGFKKVIFSPHWRYLSLGYLASRLVAVNQNFAAIVGAMISFFKLSKIIVPYYANDLYDCYAFK